MRRSFRTLRLCAIPGVSPRAGMQCPVGALRTPRLPRAPAPEPQHTCSATIIFPHRQQSTTPIEEQALNQPSSSGIGPERALEAIKPLSSRNSAKASSYPELPCECRTDPAERATSTPSGGTVTTTPRDGLGYAAFLQNAPVVRHTRGFTPGWYAVPRWGTPNASLSPSLPASVRAQA